VKVPPIKASFLGGVLLLCLGIAVYLIKFSQEADAGRGLASGGQSAPGREVGGLFQRAKLWLRDSGGESGGVTQDGYPIRAIIEGPVRSSGLMVGAADVYGLTDEQVGQINQAVENTRLEVAELIVANLEELETEEEGKVVYHYPANPELALEISDRFHAKLESIAGSKFADAGARMIRADAWLLEGGGRDIKFEFWPKIEIRDEGPRLEGTYKMDFYDASGSIGGMSGALEYLSPEDLFIDFNEILMKKVKNGERE